MLDDLLKTKNRPVNCRRLLRKVSSRRLGTVCFDVVECQNSSPHAMVKADSKIAIKLGKSVNLAFVSRTNWMSILPKSVVS